jgi:broad specificity phosphatase PhoE
MTTRVWCLRHAESENVTGGVAGAMPTARLTARGHRQAAAAARTLPAVTSVYSSTALRARETAGYLAPAIELPELAEVHLGAQEGSRAPTVHAETAAVLRAWIVDEALDRRVADGESGHEVLARVTAAFRTIATRHPDGTVAVVGHVASLTVALGRLCGLGPAVWGTPLAHAHPFLVEHKDGTWHCPSWPGVT